MNESTRQCDLMNGWVGGWVGGRVGRTDGSAAGGDAADGVFCDDHTSGLFLDEFLLDLEFFHSEEL